MFRVLYILFFPILLLGNINNLILEDEISWLEEEQFVISASKTKESIDKAPATITVIDEEMIAQMPVSNLSELLAKVPGLGISQSSVFFNMVEVRGVKSWFSEKVLFLLNGHSLNTLRNGGATVLIDKMSLENIKRIEIVRSPASSVYGENAFSALVNIITKSAKDIDSVESSIKVGSFNTKDYNLLFSNKINRDFSINGNFNYVTTDGYEAYVEKDLVGNSGKVYPKSERKHLYLNLDYKDFYLMANYIQREEAEKYGITNVLGNDSKYNYKSYFLELGHKHQFSDSFKLDTRVYYDSFTIRNKISLFPSGYPAPIYTDGMIAYPSWNSSKRGMELTAKYFDDRYTLILGASIENQKLYNPSDTQNYNPLDNSYYGSLVELSEGLRSIDPTSRNTYAQYFELLYDLTDNIRATVGARYDYFDDFGSTTNPRLGLSWRINREHSVKLLYAEAFRAPTFAELYNHNTPPTLVGNPNLKPEKVKTLELGYFNKSIEKTDIRVTLFDNKITDLIMQDSSNMYQNIGEIDSYGAEVELKHRLNRGSYTLFNYTFENPKDRTNNQSLENIAKHKFYLALNYRINKLYNLYTDLNYIGAQTKASGVASERVKAYTVLNSALNIKNFLSDKLHLKLSVKNILDKKAYDSASVFNYPIDGRSYMFELKYKF